jgi:hypothetical protein
MIPKILVTNIGERIIAGVSEVKDGETNKNLCLLIKCPYILHVNPKEDNPTEYCVNFNKWNPFSADNKFHIPYGYVVALGEVEEDLLKVYLEKFGEELYGDEENVESQVDIIEE